MNPDGLSDDMTVPLPAGRTVDDLVDFVVQRALAGVPDPSIVRDLIATFALSPEDAELVRDRVFGGVFRAGTRQVENCPDQHKDPFAWASFMRAGREPSLVAVFFPEYASTVDAQLDAFLRGFWQRNRRFFIYIGVGLILLVVIAIIVAILTDNSH